MAGSQTTSSQSTDAWRPVLLHRRAQPWRVTSTRHPPACGAEGGREHEANPRAGAGEEAKHLGGCDPRTRGEGCGSIGGTAGPSRCATVRRRVQHGRGSPGQQMGCAARPSPRATQSARTPTAATDQLPWRSRRAALRVEVFTDCAGARSSKRTGDYGRGGMGAACPGIEGTVA